MAQQESNQASGGPVTLRVDPRHMPFLADYLEAAVAGTVEQLAEAPGRLRDPFAARAYAAAFTRIITGLEDGELELDSEMRAVLVEQAQLFDDEEEYERLVAGHEAFAHLLRQLPQEGEHLEGERR